MHIQTSHQPALKLGFGDYTCNWGVHICGLYETYEERDEIIFGFLHRGDLDGDLQLYCPCERSEEDFKTRYALKFPERALRLEDPDVFQLSTAKSLYYPNGYFSPWDMDDGLQSFFEHSQQKGPRNIRASAEMVWALDAIPGAEHLMAYEARLNFFIPGKPWISICLYNLNRFSGAVVMDVLRTHPYAINGGVITENPYYQDPAEWLSRNAPEFLEKRGGR